MQEGPLSATPCRFVPWQYWFEQDAVVVEPELIVLTAVAGEAGRGFQLASILCWFQVTPAVSPAQRQNMIMCVKELVPLSRAWYRLDACGLAFYYHQVLVSPE